MRSTIKELVTVQEGYFENEEEILLTLSQFASKVGKKVVVQIFEEPEVSEPHIVENELAINFLCTPKEYSSAITYSKVYDFKPDVHTDYQLYRIYITDESSYPGRIIFDHEGNQIAVIVKNTLYVLFNLNCFDEDDSVALNEQILNDYYLYLTQKRLFVKEMKNRSVDSQSGRFINQYSNAFRSKASDNLADVESKIKRLKTDLALNVRNRTILLETIRGIKQLDCEKISSIYDSLCRLSVTKKISIRGSKVYVPIGQVNIAHNSETHDIGRFEVVIDLEECEVMAINTTRTVEGYYHPHVTEEGECCLGNASVGISVLIGQLELDTLVLMMIEFLKSYDYSNCFLKISYWPVLS